MNANRPRSPQRMFWNSAVGRAAIGTLLVTAACLAAVRAEIIIGPRATPGAANAQPGLVVPAPNHTNTVAQHEDVIEFLNGDKLHGTFISLDGRNGARWQHPAVRQVMTINPSTIAKVSLDRPRTTNVPPRQTCGVRLTNNDELVGELVSLDENNLSLNTWYAGELTIPRKMIGSISPGQARLASIYEGPTGIADWTVRGGRNNEAWKFVNDSFVGAISGSIGRDLKLPPVSNLEFDLTRRGYLQLSVSFYSDTVERYGGNSFMLQFSHSSVYLQRMTRDGNSSSLGQAQVPNLGQKVKNRISLRSNKEQKSVSLFVDGVMVKQWTDRSEFPTGGGVVFMQQGQGIVKLTNIRVSEWDGKFDEPGAAKAKTKDDLVKLANNDKVSGTLKGIKEGKMSFSTAFATLDVPMERVAEINFAEEKWEKPESKTQQVRAVFGQQGSVTFALERWDDQQVIGTSPNFGRTKFLPTAFTQLEFNLDQPRIESDPSEIEDLGAGQLIFE